MRGESGKETLRWQTLKNWRRWTHQNLHARRLHAKELLTPMKGDKFIFLVADGTVKTPGGDRRLRPSTMIRDRPERGEEQEVLGGETRDDAEAENDFWSFTGDFIVAITWNPESNSTCQEKNHFLFH